MKAALQEEKEQNAIVGSSSIQAAETKQIYVAAGRRLERFRGKPEKSTDPSVHEWVSGVKGQLAARKIKGSDAPTFIIDHLAGTARQEILGRGDIISSGDKVFRILLKVFGDGDNLPKLQQRFFAYSQGPSEDLLTCSLELIELFNRMANVDDSLKLSRDKMLKGRLAEAVRDEGLKREMRRLNIESPGMTFFDVRDWATPENNKALEGAGLLKSLLEKQGEQLQRQQQQIDTLLKAMTQRPVRQWNQGPRQSTDHLKRDCPHPPSSSAGGHSSPSGQ